MTEPLTKGSMEAAWKADPWKWFWLKPESVAASLREQGAEQWAELAENCYSIAMNGIYQVMIKTIVAGPLQEIAHFYITRVDGSKLKPWLDYQRIKNELAGPTFTALEVYPPEDELVDDIDMWHMWVLAPLCRMPFWIGNARGDEVEWWFPGIGKVKGP